MSHCTRLAPLLKKNIKHSVYIKVAFENAGELTLFIKDGHSDDIYYNTKVLDVKGKLSVLMSILNGVLYLSFAEYDF